MTMQTASERSAHERHVNLMAWCRLCRAEAGEQRDRLVDDRRDCGAMVLDSVGPTGYGCTLPSGHPGKHTREY